MAEVLPQALRHFAEYQQQQDRCALERDFSELYGILGDRDAQNAVRAKTPQGPHCPKLRANASACIGCDNNPHESPGRLAQRVKVERAGSLLTEAFRLHDLAELGLLQDASPVQVEILRIAHAEILAERIRAQASAIAHRVAEMFYGSK